MVLRGEIARSVVGCAVMNQWVRKRVYGLGDRGNGGLEGGKIGRSRSVRIILICHSWCGLLAINIPAEEKIILIKIKIKNKKSGDGDARARNRKPLV